jgi:hypothetical protein
VYWRKAEMTLATGPGGATAPSQRKPPQTGTELFIVVVAAAAATGEVREARSTDPADSES